MSHVHMSVYTSFRNPKITQIVFSEWLNKFCYVLRTEFYLAIKKPNCDASHEDEDPENYGERGNASPQRLHSVESTCMTLIRVRDWIGKGC